MAFGTLGSTLNDELNRLANGGTYRDMDDMVDEALAAKQWANRENIVPYSTDTVGILNEIAALGPNRQNWFDFNGVCNYLAGTTGLPAAAALRQITTTGDILTSLAAFYTDAATPRYNYPGYIYLNGTTGNILSVQDETALDITGDIDLRIQVAMDDWTPSAASFFMGKWLGANQYSYTFYINTNGTLSIDWSANGSTAITKTSTASVSFTDGNIGWVRATLDVNNGASGNDVKFFTSTDGTTWTQLGTTVTTAGVTSIFSSTANLAIGGYNAVLGNTIAGRLYRAQIFASIDGTDKRFDADLTTNVTSATYDQFTATTGQLCTINGQNTLTNGGSAGSLLPVTVGSSLAADSNDAKFLDHTGTNYVYLPGLINNYIYVRDVAPLDITGDIDLRWYGAMDDWTPAASMTFFGKSSSVSNFAYGLRLEGSGTITLRWTADGSTMNARTSTVAPTVADGAPLWVRATLDVDNGAAGHDVKFYTSTDGTTWTQLGTTVTTAGTTSIFNSNGDIHTTTLGIAAADTSGKVYRIQVYSDITGTTKVLDVDTSVITSGADTYVVPTTYTGQAGAYFTGSGLSLNGVAGNYVSTPDYAALDITGDLDLQVKVALPDWTPAAQSTLISKWTTVGNQRSYRLDINTSGVLIFYWTTDGTTTVQSTASAPTGITDGETKWVRATMDVNNGASGNDVKFWLSDDGVNWTQIGTTITTAGVTSIFAGTANLEIGSNTSGAGAPAVGTFYRAEVLSGINGYPVFDADFTQVPANALRMTESSINKAVVTLNTTRYATINRSTSGRKSVAVTQPTWLFGTDDYMEVNNRYMAHSTSDENYVYLSGAVSNYMSIPDNPPLDITSDIDIQVKVALDDWTPAAFQTLIAKYNTTGNQRTYRLDVSTTGTLALVWSVDGVTPLTANSTVATGITDGAVKWIRATLDVDNGASGNDVKFYLSDNGTTWTQLGTTVTTAGVTSIYSSTQPQEIGAYNFGQANPAKGKFFRAIIKNGIDGTTVLDANAATITLPSQTTFTDSSSNAYTVTINKSGVGTFVSTGNYLYLPGIGTNWASTPDSAAVSVTGDIDLRCKVALDDWTPSSAQFLIFKDAQGGNQRSYTFYVRTDGKLALGWFTDGTNGFEKISTVAPTVSDGATLWVRGTLDVDNGAAGNDVKFFTSTDGITWTQLGTTVTTAGTTNVFDGNVALGIGSNSVGNSAARGKYFRAQVYNGINGTLAFDANFEGSITSLNQASFTESSSNAATVTINRSGSAYRSAGVIDAGYLYPGATNTFANSTIDYLDFGATDSFTVVAIARKWASAQTLVSIISKAPNGFVSPGYRIQQNNSASSYSGFIRDTSNTALGTAISYNSGDLKAISSVINRTTQTITDYDNGTALSTVSTSSVGSLQNILTLRIGTWGDLQNYADFEFIGAAVFRQALTATQIRQITNYFANREAYL